MCLLSINDSKQRYHNPEWQWKAFCEYCHPHADLSSTQTLLYSSSLSHMQLQKTKKIISGICNQGRTNSKKVLLYIVDIARVKIHLKLNKRKRKNATKYLPWWGRSPPWQKTQSLTFSTTACLASSRARSPPGLKRIDLAMTPFCLCPNNWKTSSKNNRKSYSE